MEGKEEWRKEAYERTKDGGKGGRKENMGPDG